MTARHTILACTRTSRGPVSYVQQHNRCAPQQAQAQRVVSAAQLRAVGCKQRRAPVQHGRNGKRGHDATALAAAATHALHGYRLVTPGSLEALRMQQLAYVFTASCKDNQI